jgi:hypothetical protein
VPATTCICIKYGTRYGPEYPNRLRAGLRRQASGDIRLFCMTDDRAGLDPGIEILPLAEEPFFPAMFAEMERRGWKSPFRKISLFRPGLIPDLDGPLLVFDLDVVIVGDVAPMAAFAPGRIAMRREWHSSPKRPSLGHGSVEKIEPNRHGWLYEDVARDPVAALASGYGSEQSYTSLNAAARGELAHFPDDWVASFKYDCRPPRPLNLIRTPRCPPGAKVICFHGNPKMEQAVDGYRGGPLQATRPAPWLKSAWIGVDA